MSAELLERSRRRIREILPTADLKELTAKALRQQLEREFGVDLKPVRKLVDQITLQELETVVGGSSSGGVSAASVRPASPGSGSISAPGGTSVPPPRANNSPSPRKTGTKPAGRRRGVALSAESVRDDDGSGSSDYEDEDDGDAAANTDADHRLALQLQRDEQMSGHRRTRHRSTTDVKVARGRKRGATAAQDPLHQRKKQRANTGFMKELVLSEPLRELMDGAVTMARPEIVKRLWAYIKGNGLQDPADRRFILCDTRLMAVMDGKPRVSGFAMNKFLSKHVASADEITGGGSGSKNSDLVSDIDDEDIERIPKTVKKKKAKKTGSGKVSGLMKPLRLSAALSAVVGSEELPRPTVVKQLWSYVRLHGLQDPEDKRFIVCDDKLRAVMGGRDRVSMFGMNKLLSVHMHSAGEMLGDAVADKDGDYECDDVDEGDEDDEDEVLVEGLDENVASKASDYGVENDGDYMTAAISDTTSSASGVADIAAPTSKASI